MQIREFCQDCRLQGCYAVWLLEDGILRSPARENLESYIGEYCQAARTRPCGLIAIERDIDISGATVLAVIDPLQDGIKCEHLS
jgi:hypothetical protein